MHFYRHTIYQRGGSQAIFVELLYVSLPTLTSLSKLLVVKCERCHEVRWRFLPSTSAPYQRSIPVQHPRHARGWWYQKGQSDPMTSLRVPRCHAHLFSVDSCGSYVDCAQATTESLLPRRCELPSNLESCRVVLPNLWAYICLCLCRNKSWY